MTQSHNRVAKDETGVERRLKMPGSVSYLHIPAVDAQKSAAFYETVFGWSLRERDSARPSFDDPSGHVSGAWITGQTISREPGLLPYIYVEHIDATTALIRANGGEVITDPFAEGNLWVATFRDPAGNLLGLWHAGPR
jgi:uncharacterized protein